MAGELPSHPYHTEGWLYPRAAMSDSIDNNNTRKTLMIRMANFTEAY